MTAKITLDILESYLQCKYKCHLKLLGEHGTPSAYEQLMRETRHRLRLAARDALLSQHGERESLCNHAVTVTVLEQSAPLLLDALVEDERLSVRFDALQRAPGPSKLGDFHYIPVLFHEAELQYPRTFYTDLINLTCKIPGQETFIVNEVGMKHRRCSGLWPMQVIDILTTGEYCSWSSTRSAWPDSVFPSVLLFAGLPHAV